MTAMMIDMHTHAGRRGRGDSVDSAVLASMGPGGMAAAVVSAIPDLPLIRRDAVTRALCQVRTAEPGECWAVTQRQLAGYRAAGMRIATEPAEVVAGDPALVLAVEGCDFLDGDLDRLDRLAAEGVRSVQLVHYCVNETGDIQTAPPVHGGLTALGAGAVKRMNALGLMVDVAHCTEAVVRGVVAASTRPILCTHANLAEPDLPDGGHRRFISRDYARLVAGTGGVIGAWISVLWEERIPGLVRHLCRLVDAVGVEHVGIGTDMPSGVAAEEMPDFSRHGGIAAALRARGISEEDVAKICAGNWLRVFRAAREGMGA
jgi:membrane dipeptidase